MKTLLMYTGIYSFTAEEFIKSMAEVGDEDLTIRVNCPGGDVFAGWGMIKDISEKKNLTYQVDGYAASMGFFASLFAAKVTALDVSKFLVHRADGYCNTEEDREFLANVNRDIREKFESRIDAKVFEEVTGVSVDTIFEGEIRKDLWINAKDAQKMGLVDEVVRLETREQKAMSRMAADTEFAEKLGFVTADKQPIDYNYLVKNF